MKRGVLLMAMLLMVWPAQAGEFWSKLWRNADQRGEALLQQGDAKGAANAYVDPVRKAYAKLKAGDYQGAAKDLAAVQGSDAAYNRGNALAYSGDLQGALAAYDAALKADPNNQDAKHNRDLVAQQLKQQTGPSQKNDTSSNNSPNNGQQKDGAQNSGDQSAADTQQGDRQGQSSSGQNSGSQNSGSQNQQGQNNGSQKQGENANSANTGNDKNIQYNQNNTNQKAGDGQQQQGEQSSDNPMASSAQQAAGAAKDDAEQARRDAEASLGQATAGENKNGDKKFGASESAVTPKTENQLAQEQWLRSIPDDPAGLLRRKFMIEHLIRQQKAKQ